MAVASTVSVEDVFSPKEIGESFEVQYARRLTLGLIPDSIAEWHDAVATTAIFPSGVLPFYGIAVVAKGVPVEIKVAKKWVPNGAHRSRGRWLIKRSAHEQLLDAGGVYLLGVHTETNSGTYEVVRQAVVPASLLDEHLKTRWFDAPDHRSEGEVAQLGWSHVLTPEVDDGE